MMRPNDSRCVIGGAGLDQYSCPQCGATLGLSAVGAADRAGGRSPYSSGRPLYSSTIGDSVATKRIPNDASESAAESGYSPLSLLKVAGPSRRALRSSRAYWTPIRYVPPRCASGSEPATGEHLPHVGVVDARDLAVNYEFKASLTSCVSDVSSWPRSIRSTPLVPSTAAIRSCEPL